MLYRCNQYKKTYFMMPWQTIELYLEKYKFVIQLQKDQ